MAKQYGLLTMVQNLLALLATISPMVFFCGYVALNEPLRRIFGITLPFTAQDYLYAGISKLAPIVPVLLLGFSAGVMTSAKEPELGRSKLSRWTGTLAIVLGGLSFGVAQSLANSKLSVVLYAATFLPLGYIIGFMTLQTAETYMFLVDKEGQVAGLGALINSQEMTLTERSNDPSLLRLKRGQPNDKLLAAEQESILDVQRKRVEEAKKILEDTVQKRRKARQYWALVVLIVSAMYGVLVYLGNTFVEKTSQLDTGGTQYRLMRLTLKEPVPEFGTAQVSGDTFTQTGKFILKVDGLVYLLTTDGVTGVILPEVQVLRMVPLVPG